MIRSARDDYPEMAIAALEDGYPISELEITGALNEIDTLRRWKHECVGVLEGWEETYQAAGSPGPLGGKKSENLRNEIDRLRRENARLYARIEELEGG